MSRLSGKIALITGASRGIGAAIAKRYAKEGATIIAIARTRYDLEKLDDEVLEATGRNLVLVPFDLTEYDKIDELGMKIMERFGKLDILVGNAGILGGLRPLPHYSGESFERVMAVNLTANFRLIRSFDALLKQSDAGRAIFVTSGITRGIFPYWGAYATSKAALEVMVKTYAAESSVTNIKANLVDPGVVRTKMRAEAMPGEDPMNLPLPEQITDIFVKLAEAELKDSGKIFHV